MSRKSSKSKIVFVALSGGVDSSVAAYLLKKAGYRVIAIFIRGYNLDGCADIDVEDARRVAERLDIPFFVWDFEEEYKKKVVHYLIEGYREGITPNPDVQCNKEIKFGLFFKKAIAAGADFIATGHYALIKKNQGQKVISIPKDKEKDQTYFLWTLSSSVIRHTLFPLGRYLKEEVRKIATKVGLPNANKKDSQGICFLGKIKLVDFLKKHIPERKGPIVSPEGKIIGEHNGIYYYTVGQRHGLGYLKHSSSSTPYYVANKLVISNTLVVAEGRAHPLLYRSNVNLKEVNFTLDLSRSNLSFPLNVLVRIRYRQKLSKAVLKRTKGSRGRFQIIFEEPQRAVAKGQSAVFYTPQGILLGGGIIS